MKKIAIAAMSLIIVSLFAASAYCEGKGFFEMLSSGCNKLTAWGDFKFINYSDKTYPPKPDDSPVDIFFQNKPQKNYEVIGEIIGHLSSENEIKPVLSAKARQVGGDGIIDIDMSEGSQTQSYTSYNYTYHWKTHSTIQTPVSNTYSHSVINIKGKVIRYK